MNSFTTTHGQPFLAELKKSKESMIPNLINNLKIKEVETDTAFEESKRRIKRAVQVTPVTLGIAQFIDYSYQKRETSWQMQFNGIGSDVYTHKIAIPFEGDRELFYHVPDSGFTFSSSDHGLLIPTGNSRIVIEVDLFKLDPEQAVKEAEVLFRLTKGFIQKNNDIVKVWKSQMEAVIDIKIAAKREELIRLFGEK